MRGGLKGEKIGVKRQYGMVVLGSQPGTKVIQKGRKKKDFGEWVRLI